MDESEDERMNLSAIKKCCGQTKRAEIITDRNGDQWISNAVAMYRARIGMDADTLVELLDLTGKQIGEWMIGEVETRDWRVSAYPDDRDVPMEEIGRVMLGNETLLVLSGDPGIVLVNARYLKPVKDDYRRYFLRHEEGAVPMIAVFGDLTCSALVCPISDRGNRTIRKLAEAIAGRPWVVPTESDAANAEAEAERMMKGGI